MRQVPKNVDGAAPPSTTGGRDHHRNNHTLAMRSMYIAIYKQHSSMCNLWIPFPLGVCFHVPGRKCMCARFLQDDALDWT